MTLSIKDSNIVCVTGTTSPLCAWTRECGLEPVRWRECSKSESPNLQGEIQKFLHNHKSDQWKSVYTKRVFQNQQFQKFWTFWKPPKNIWKIRLSVKSTYFEHYWLSVKTTNILSLVSLKSLLIFKDLNFL